MIATRLSPDRPGNRVEFYCLCGKKLWARPDAAGKRFRCSGCGEKGRVPGPAPFAWSSLAGEPDPPAEEPAESARGSTADRVGAVVSGLLLCGFIAYLIRFGSDDLPAFKVQLVAVLAALAAGLLGYFLSGSLTVGIERVKTPWGRFGLKATGGAAAFVVILVWWVGPWSPVRREAEDDRARLKTQVVQLEGSLEAVLRKLPVGADGRLLAGSIADQLPDEVRKQLAELKASRSPYARGLAALAEGRLDDALKELDAAERAGDADPGRIDLARARAHRQAGRWADAAACYDKAAAALPDDPAVLNEAGLAHQSAGNHARAVELLHTAVDRCDRGGADPKARVVTLAAALGNLAWAAGAGSAEQAERYADKAVSVLTGVGETDSVALAEALCARAFVRLRAGRVREGGADLRRAIGMYTAAGLRHRGAVTRLRLALATSVHARQGEYREAEDLCRDVLQQLTDAAAPGPQQALVHDELAGLFLAQAVKEADPAERARHLDAADAEIDDGLALRGPDHPAAADGRELKARVAEARGDLAAAEKISREVLAVREKAAAAPSRQADLGLAATASHLAEILHRQGKDAEAEQLFRQALALYRKVDGPDSVQAGLTLSLLGDMAREVGRLDDAARDYKAAVVVLRKSTGRGSPALALTLSSLRTTFRLIAGKALIEGRSADAQAAAERLIALLEELREPVTAEELHLLAGAYQAQGRYALAEKAGEQALDRLRREKNPDPVAKAQLVGFVAAACHLQDRYARAVELAREAVVLVRSLPKTEAPLAVAPLCVLAEAYRDLARYPEAEAALKDLDALCAEGLKEPPPADGDELEKAKWAGRQMTFRGTQPLVRLLLAGVYQRQGRFAEAARVFSPEMLGVVEATVGADHPSFAELLVCVGLLYLDRGDADAAAGFLDRAVKVMDSRPGQLHPARADAVCGLGRVALAKGRHAEAVRRFEEALKVWEATRGPRSVRVAEGKYHLARARLAAGKADEAGELLRQARELFTAAFGPDHPWVADCLEELAAVYRRTGRAADREEAEWLLRDLRVKFPRPVPPKGR